MDIDGLEARIGYRLNEKALLTQALTHRSHGQLNNERLEFLGDSVLNCAIASVLFERFPLIDEGDLSRVRAYLVKQQALHSVAQRLRLGENLVLGEGESRSGGTRRPSILADALEALIGAVYLDTGFEAAKELIARLYEPELLNADPRTLGKDAKTLLQEELQRNRVPLPIYEVVATHGAAHSQVFDVECVITRLDVRALGTGGSRRAAEQAAAECALRVLNTGEKSDATKAAKAAARKKTRSAAGKNAKSPTEAASLGSPIVMDANGSKTKSAPVNGHTDDAGKKTTSKATGKGRGVRAVPGATGSA